MTSQPATPTYYTFRSAADESEVRGRVIGILDGVNKIAEMLGIPMKCSGGGSGRSMSFTDLVVRPADGQTDPNSVSSQIFGTVEVKGDWQFQLNRGERLEDALHDPKRTGAVVIQQVGADKRLIVSCCMCGSCA